MPTLNGLIRSYQATARRLEREEQRRLRAQAAAQNADAAAAHQNYVNSLITLHCVQIETIDWFQLASQTPPEKPTPVTDAEDRARAALHNFTPGFLDRRLNRADSKREALLRKLEEAMLQDDKTNGASRAAYETAYTEWQETTGIAKALLADDTNAWRHVLYASTFLNDDEFLARRISLSAFPNRTVRASVRVHNKESIPAETKTHLKSGKLSVKPLSKSRYNELYQDHVCSAILAVSNALFSLFPADFVIVNAYADLLNSKTGHFEEAPILSVALPRATFKRLNLQNLDPSDAMQNFVHNMDFRPTRGFLPVDTIDPNTFTQSASSG